LKTRDAAAMIFTGRRNRFASFLEQMRSGGFRFHRIFLSAIVFASQIEIKTLWDLFLISMGFVCKVDLRGKVFISSSSGDE